MLLFVDEIHRFSKAQQDAFLPFVESGKIVLVGATAENPSFYLNSALLSRMRVLKLGALDAEALKTMVARYEANGRPLKVTPEAKEHLVELASGDGRYLFNLIEAIETSDVVLDVPGLLKFVSRRAALGDKLSDTHYNLISALHKSLRGSDPDAALYWFARMLEGGEDPLFIVRRLIRAAAEDVGLADPYAMEVALRAAEGYGRLGSPEGDLLIAEAVVYLALAPKSNAVYKAFGEAKSLASKTAHLEPPLHILNAPTGLMKEAGYGKGYCYDHDVEGGFSGQNYFPQGLEERPVFYRPVERGFEREMKKRVEYFQAKRGLKA